MTLNIDPLGLLAGMAPRPFPDFLSWLIERLWGTNAGLARYWLLEMGMHVDASAISKWTRGERRPQQANVEQIEQAVRHLYRAREMPQDWEELAVRQLWQSWNNTKPARTTPAPDTRILRELDRFAASYAPEEQDEISDAFVNLVRLAEHFYQAGYEAGYADARKPPPDA